MTVKTVLWGLVAWGAAVVGALFVRLLDTDANGLPRYDTLIAGMVLVATAPILLSGWLVYKDADNRNLTIAIAASILWIAGSMAMYRLFFLATFPADLLSATESNFVNDVIKLSMKAKLYGPPDAFDSYAFPPGAPAVTYGLAWLFGGSRSIATLRSVQIVYALMSAAGASACFILLIRRAAPDVAWRLRSVWGVVVFPLFFLMAVNPHFNAHSTVLGSHGLGQFMFVAGYVLLLEYVHYRNRWLLAAMIAMPALGFLVEQYQVAWLAVYAGFFALFDEERSPLRAAVVGVGGVIATTAVALVCLAVWEEPFRYWVLGALERYGSDPQLSRLQLIRGSSVYILTFAGAALWWFGPRERGLWGTWVMIVAALVAFTLSTNAATALNHLGPAALLGTVWFLAALVSFYERSSRPIWSVVPVAGAIVLALAATGSVQRPENVLRSEASAYVSRVASELESGDLRKILVDLGAFVHLDQNRVWRDGAESVGEAVRDGTYTDDSLEKRIQGAYYDKILVRLSEPNHYSPAIRQALSKAYRVKRTIPAADIPLATRSPGFSEVTVMVRRAPPPRPRAGKLVDP